MEIIRSGGVVIHDSFPAVPGEIPLTVFLRNPLSKEFSIFESAVSIPAAARPRLAPPLTGFKAENLASNFYCAYKAGGRRLAVDPDQVFAAARVPLLWLGAYNLDRSLWEKGRFEWEIRGLNERRPFRQENAAPAGRLPLSAQPQRHRKDQLRPPAARFLQRDREAGRRRRRHPRQPRNEFPGLAAGFPGPAERNVQPGHGGQPVLFRLSDRPAVPRPRRPGESGLWL